MCDIRAFVAKLNAKEKNEILELSWEVSRECTNVRVQIKRQGENWTEKTDTNARMFVAKFNAKEKNAILKLSLEVSHECTNVRVQIKRQGEIERRK